QDLRATSCDPSVRRSTPVCLHSKFVEALVQVVHQTSTHSSGQPPAWPPASNYGGASSPTKVALYEPAFPRSLLYHELGMHVARSHYWALEAGLRQAWWKPSA
ncbi:unnamed protein product, partial [Ectocarpus sp. 12 AP-2014]